MACSINNCLKFQVGRLIKQEASDCISNWQVLVDSKCSRKRTNFLKTILFERRPGGVVSHCAFKFGLNERAGAGFNPKLTSSRNMLKVESSLRKLIAWKVTRKVIDS